MRSSSFWRWNRRTGCFSVERFAGDGGTGFFAFMVGSVGQGDADKDDDDSIAKSEGRSSPSNGAPSTRRGLPARAALLRERRTLGSDSLLELLEVEAPGGLLELRRGGGGRPNGLLRVHIGLLGSDGTSDVRVVAHQATDGRVEGNAPTRELRGVSLRSPLARRRVDVPAFLPPSLNRWARAERARDGARSEAARPYTSCRRLPDSPRGTRVVGRPSPSRTESWSRSGRVSVPSPSELDGYAALRCVVEPVAPK
jgi:hypothetical protein